MGSADLAPRVLPIQSWVPASPTNPQTRDQRYTKEASIVTTIFAVTAILRLLLSALEA